MILTIVVFIIVLSVLVFAHELGHFAMARRFGVKAEEFGLGFPPRAYGFYKNSQGKWKHVFGRKEITDCPGTVYSINWLPLGGFVKIKGENGEGETESDSFASRPIWQRAIMLSAGVVMNIILAMVLIISGFMVGLPQVLDGSLNSKAIISDQKIQIVQVIKDSPAQQADIKGGIGVAISETGIVRYPWYLAIWQGIATTFIVTWTIIVAFYDLIKGLIFGHGVTADLSGPVGIATLTGQVARMGFIYLMQFTALLSINLAVINFFPFPALDGGRVLFLIIEKIKRAPVKRELEGMIHNIGFVLLMVLVVIVTFRDVSRFGNIFKIIWEKLF